MCIHILVLNLCICFYLWMWFYFDNYIHYIYIYTILNFLWQTLIYIIIQDGTVNVHTIKEGQFVRTLTPPGCTELTAEITFLSISAQGQVAIAAKDQVRFVYSFIIIHLFIFKTTWFILVYCHMISHTNIFKLF